MQNRCMEARRTIENQIEKLSYTDTYSEHISYCFHSTPLGDVVIAESVKGICLLEFTDRKNIEGQINLLTNFCPRKFEQNTSTRLQKTKHELDSYFDGSLKNFSIELDIDGTEFQKQTWNALLKIPYGQTISYSEQALELDRPNAIRAVASANAKNKIAIIIPCHRVIRKDGSLSGYAGGVSRKKSLLEIERGINV